VAPSSPGEAIRLLRKKLHWSQRELAARAGLSRTKLGRWERGKARVSAAQLWIVCTALAVGYGTDPATLWIELVRVYSLGG
jgi:transcriptional regulator with XRE-family HTH domain